MTLFTKLEKEQLVSIVLRSMIFRFTDQEIINEIQKVFPNKGIVSKPTLSRIKKEIRTRNMNMYNSMKMTQDLFLSKIMEKYQNIDIYIREYFAIFNNEKTNDITKLRILEKIAELDQTQLRMHQDFPYLEVYHKDARDELARLEADIKELKEEITEQQNPKTLEGNCVNNKQNQNRIPLDSITKDKEIQAILLSRTKSGFETRLLRRESTQID